MKKMRRMGKGLCILSALLLMFLAVGCDDSDSTAPVSNSDVSGVDAVTTDVSAAITPGGTISTVGVVSDGETDADVMLDANSVARNAAGDALNGTINMTLAARDAEEDDVDMPALTTTDMNAAGFDADAQAYLANFNENDEVTFASFGEMTASATVGGEAVDAFTVGKRFGAGPCMGRMRLGSVTGFSEGMYVPIFGFFGGVFAPVDYAPILFNATGNYWYVQFYFFRMGRYRCGWFVPRVSFDLKDSLSNDCELTLTVDENGAGTVTALAYAFKGDFGTSGSVTGNSFSVYAGYGSDQMAILKLKIYYTLPFGYTRPYFRKYLITVDCLSGSV